MAKLRFTSNSYEETEKIGCKLGKSLKKALVCLYGELGCGKTTLIRGIAKGLGIKSRVQSPTFTYQRIHTGKYPLYHFDFYRTKPNIILLNDLEDAIQKNDGVIAIEWPQHIVSFLPENRINIDLIYIDDNKREILIKNYDRFGSRKSNE